MSYEFVTLHPFISINEICTIHYFEYMNDFSFPGESHDFWEFLCVDKGEVNVVAGKEPINLHKDEIIFHRPDEFHAVYSNGTVAPNLVVISFRCQSPAMDFFSKKILSVNDEEKRLLGLIIQEAKQLFSTPLDDPYVEKMELSSQVPPGCEQMVKTLLEQFLIKLYRRALSGSSPKPVSSVKQKTGKDRYEQILSYLEENLHTHLTIEQICRDNLIGRSQLQKLFREKNGCGVIDYFSHIRVDAAKQMIRNQNLNFTQIADSLGYNSIHYFSRQFKKITGMTPSEYSSSIKKLSEEPSLR